MPMIDHHRDKILTITHNAYESSFVTVADIQAIEKKLREASRRSVCLQFCSCRFEDAAADALEKVIHDNGRSNLQALNLLFVNNLQPWRIGRLILAPANLQKAEFAIKDTEGAREVFDASKQHRSTLTHLAIMVPRSRGQMEAGLPRVIAGGILNFPKLAIIRLIIPRLTDAGLATIIDGILLLKQEIESIQLNVTGGLSHVSLLALIRLLKGLSARSRVELDISNCTELFFNKQYGNQFVATIENHPPQMLQLSNVGLDSSIASQLIRAAEHMSNPQSQLHLEGRGFANDDTFFRQVATSLPHLPLTDLSIYDYENERKWNNDQESIILKALKCNTTIGELLLSPGRSRHFSQGITTSLSRNRDIQRVFKVLHESLQSPPSVDGWIATLARVCANKHGASPCFLVVQHNFQEWI